MAGSLGAQLKFQELDAGDGSPPRYLVVEGAIPQPLGFEALQEARADAPLTVRFDWRGAKVVDTDIPDFDRSAPRDLTATVQSPFTSRAILLVRGGWLPSSPYLVDPKTIFLLDRNVISEVAGRFSGGASKGRDPDFMDIFASVPVRLNPMLAVLEGAQRRVPTEEETKAQLAEITAKLKAALPNAEFLAGPDFLQGVNGLIAEGRAWFNRHQAFLLRAASIMPGPVARRRRAACWQDILEAADADSVPRTSLVLLTVLCGLFAPNGIGPARATLKFRAGYTVEDAYNALCDLRSLELFLNLLGVFPEQPANLCTGDRALALLWVGMGFEGVGRSNTGTTIDFSFDEALMPPEAAAWWRAASEIP